MRISGSYYASARQEFPRSLFIAVILGALLALSSTVVVLKVLMGRGELGALQGRVALGILLAQDIAVVPMVVVLPTLAAGGEGLPTALALAAAKATAVLLGAYLIGARAMPWLLDHIAGSRSRELFLLFVVGHDASLAFSDSPCTKAEEIGRGKI